MRGKFIVFSLIAVLSNAATAGDIFRCVAANGDVMYTNLACPADSHVQHITSYQPVPDVPVAPYKLPTNAYNAGQARSSQQAAYQAGYEQAQAEAQNEQSSDEGEYAPGWIPFYPVVGSRFHDHRFHTRQTMATHLPHAPRAVFALRH